jgi:PAS domain S-box-containing protein
MTAFSSSSQAGSSGSHIDSALLETIVSLVPGNVYWARLDGTILGANEAQAKAFGFSDKNKLVGKRLREVCSNQMVARQHEANNEKVLQEHKTLSFEEWDEQPGQGRVCYLANRAPLQHQGITIGVLCVSIDITKQKVLELQLRTERDNAIHLVKENESLIYGLYQSITGKRPQERMPIDHLIKSFRTFYENILAVLPFHVYWMDRSGKYLGCNDNQAKSMGLKSRLDVIGKKNSELPNAEVADPLIIKALDDTNEKIMSSGEALSLEEKDPSGAKISLTRKLPMRDALGEVIGLVGISVDITAEKSLEEMKLKVMTTEEGVKTSRLLAQIIAHELRTPFSAMDFMMDGLAQYLSPMIKEAQAKNIIPERSVKYLEAIPARMSKILYSANRFIDMMLMMGNIDNLKAELSPLSMKETLEHALKSYPFMEGDEALLKLDFSKDFKIKGDLKLLEHVIFNLLKNAIYYVKSAQKGRIEIWLEPAENAANSLELHPMNILHFKDTGKGISPSILPFIFEPFFSRTRHGTGIGLAFCRRVMQEHQGSISCESIEGEFAHFILSFPVLN